MNYYNQIRYWCDRYFSENSPLQELAEKVTRDIDPEVEADPVKFFFEHLNTGENGGEKSRSEQVYYLRKYIDRYLRRNPEYKKEIIDVFSRDYPGAAVQGFATEIYIAIYCTVCDYIKKIGKDDEINEGIRALKEKEHKAWGEKNKKLNENRSASTQKRKYPKYYSFIYYFFNNSDKELIGFLSRIVKQARYFIDSGSSSDFMNEVVDIIDDYLDKEPEMEENIMKYYNTSNWNTASNKFKDDVYEMMDDYYDDYFHGDID